MFRKSLLTSVATASFAIGLTVSSPVHATLALNAAGVADGFTLSTFVSGYNFGNYGPLAQGIAPNGNVITGSVGDLRIYVFHDVDGQTLGSAVSATPYVAVTGNPNWAMTTAGGQVYGAQAFGGPYQHFANDGSFSPIGGAVGTTLRDFLGMWGDPVNGHIIAAANVGLVEIDPVAGTFRVIVPGLAPDGVSVSPDGLIAYVENGGTIQSYNIATGALIHTFFTGHSPDGTGVISGGLFNGDVIVNNNDGTLGLLNPTKLDGDPAQFVIIASGGTRGDFVSADTSNGTLFISQIERVDRLSCGPGCSIGGPPPPSLPEPATLALLAVGLAGVGFWRRRKSN